MADNDFPGARQKLYYSVWSASRARSLGPPFAGNADSTIKNALGVWIPYA
jgi:hypothetical protein